MRAPTPANQSERLAALAGYRILETEREKDFDDLVEIAQLICDVPIALVSLVSHDQQWFKAEIGLCASSTSLDEAICGYTILGTDVLEIPDTRLDPRTTDNPLCSRENEPLLFYAGAPLITPDGHALGAFCVLDYKPRKLDDVQKATLTKLASQAMAQMELRRAMHDQNVLRSEMDHRVKNSLQTVESFIRIYRSKVSSDEAKDALAAIGRRVSSISQLHAELYKSDTGDVVRLDDYLNRVSAHASDAVRSGITVQTELQAVKADSRKAACYAMIVSEFVANANKYAFPDGRDGVVTVSLTETDDGVITLTCRDNGVGNAGRTDSAMPAGAKSLPSIGLRLMESAASQTGSSFEVHADENGYRIDVVSLSGQPQG